MGALTSLEPALLPPVAFETDVVVRTRISAQRLPEQERKARQTFAVGLRGHGGFAALAAHRGHFFRRHDLLRARFSLGCRFCFFRLTLGRDRAFTLRFRTLSNLAFFFLAFSLGLLLFTLGRFSFLFLALGCLAFLLFALCTAKSARNNSLGGRRQACRRLPRPFGSPRRLFPTCKSVRFSINLRLPISPSTPTAPLRMVLVAVCQRSGCQWRSN